jgi:hypothetical protein
LFQKFIMAKLSDKPRTSAVTRSQSSIWLIGETVAVIGGCKLPSNGDVLRRFFKLHKTDKRPIKDAAAVVADEIDVFWTKARIPTKARHHVAGKVQQAFANWRKLLKGRNRRSCPQLEKERNFKLELKNLFDIAHEDALQLITIAEDREFLVGQRESGRRGSMAGVDEALAGREKRRDIRARARKRSIEKEKNRIDAQETAVLSDESDNGDGLISNEDLDAEERPVEQACKAKRAKKRLPVVTVNLAAALDRTKTSDRNAAYILSQAAVTFNKDASNVSVSRSTIRRTRMKFREETAISVKQLFSPTVPLTVHWDGKIFTDIHGEKVERLAIIVTGEDVCKLLDAPKLSSGTGVDVASAVHKCLLDWRIADRVQSMCFDTTASNTGLRNGACALLQQKLNRTLLYLACRHHILEIVVGKVFQECLEASSSGPDIPMFKRFKESWSKINKGHYQAVAIDVEPDPFLHGSSEVVNFCNEQLQIIQPRDDYKELLELTIVTLGCTPRRGVHFRAPGAIHRARWMAKAIYALKIYLFRQEFHLTPLEKSSLRRFVVFVVTTYVRAWFTAPCAAAAPANDLRFLQNIVAYGDRAISKAAELAFTRHLWYLSEHLVVLALFDKDVSVQTKQEIVAALENDGLSTVQQRAAVDTSLVASMTLQDFVTKSSKLLFDVLSISTNFLAVNPDEWDGRDDYHAAVRCVRGLRVVNDFAERGIAMIQDYSDKMTKDEQQKQFLLQTVELHRCRFPTSSKSVCLPSGEKGTIPK